MGTLGSVDKFWCAELKGELKKLWSEKDDFVREGDSF
jgi:hypothetical protein